METNDNDRHVPRWHDDSHGTAEGTVRYFYGVLDFRGRPELEDPYVEIVKSDTGVTNNHGEGTSLWCYSYDGSGYGWLELPEGITTLEEAQATALTLWRMYK